MPDEMFKEEIMGAMQFNIRKKLHLCGHCPYETTYLSHLKYHLRVHTRERPFQCSCCSLTFTTKSNMLRHMKALHPNFLH